MKPEEALYPRGSAKAGMGERKRKLRDMHTRIAQERVHAGSTSLLDGVFPCISEHPMLPFVLFYSVNNLS